MRPPDPHNLRTAAASVPRIADDRECAGCGYNLRGLPMRGRCPECGMPIGDSSGVDEPLSLAPVRVILTFIRGCWAASIILALSVGMLAALRFPDWPAGISRWSLVPLSILWVGAVAWLTPAIALPQAASRGFSRRSPTRRVARWAQWGWAVAAATRLLEHELSMTGTTATLTQAGLIIGVLTGLAGMVALCVLLERLSEWTRDDHAQNLFNWAMWSIPITTGLVFIGLPLGGNPILSRVSIGLSALWLVGVGIFPYALLSLSSSVTLSVVHSYEHRQREERRAERRDDHQRKIAETVRTMDAERARRQSLEGRPAAPVRKPRPGA